MAKEAILVVEDEADISELVVYNLRKEGYQAETVTSGEDALRCVKKTAYALIILDLMLPGVDGLTVCKSLKSDRAAAQIPILMLTAKSEETDIVVGLELGASDYVTKPFSPRILLARVKAALRQRQQTETASSDVIFIHELRIDPSRYEVVFKGEPLKLTTTEFGILVCLARRPGWVFTRYQIVEAVRGEDYIVTDRAVDVQIAGLRKKLGGAGQYIETIRGVGYKFNDRQENRL